LACCPPTSSPKTPNATAGAVPTRITGSCSPAKTEPPLYGDEATKRFGQLCDEAGVRRVRLHDLRHGAASLRLAAGVDIAIVSKILGHSSVAITADTYSHLLEGVGREAAERAMSLVPRTARDSRETGGLPSGSRSPEDDHERSAETGNTPVGESAGGSRLRESNPGPTHYEVVLVLVVLRDSPRDQQDWCGLLMGVRGHGW